MTIRYGNVIGAFVILAASATQAHAQYGGYGYGYGGFGWGGWMGGASPPGDIARGLGYFAAGVGQYNLQTAMAASINSDTIGRWNEFMFLSQMEANHREHQRMDQRMKRDARASELTTKRLNENPTSGDITNGGALNAALDQLTDPRIHHSALRMAKTPISGELIRTIPFVNASEAVTISLEHLTAKDNWPVALRGETFAPEREAYEDAVEQALKEDLDGELTQATAGDVRAAARRLRAKLEKFPPAEREQLIEAQNYVKTLTGLSRMLERPGIDKVLNELEKIDKTTIGSLLGFMHTFNLRFGPATTPRQRAAYQQLYPLLDAERDKLISNTEVASRSIPSPKKQPTDFFQGMHLDHLEGKASAPANRSK